MIIDEIKEGFLLICNEMNDSILYSDLMELYNRVVNILKLQNGILLIEGMEFEIDVIEHINLTKIKLDQFISQQLESDAIVQGHRRISSGLSELKKQFQQQEKLQLHEPSNILLNQAPISQIKSRQNIFQQKQQKEDLNEELEEEIMNISLRMKGIASNIQNRLQQDQKIIKKIETKQDQSQNQLVRQEGRLSKFMKSKSLSCSTLLMMLIVSVMLFVFGIVFIKLF